ncbi:unnamed protein product, partial [Staurois parvus]
MSWNSQGHQQSGSTVQNQKEKPRSGAEPKSGTSINQESNQSQAVLRQSSPCVCAIAGNSSVGIPMRISDRGSFCRKSLTP